MKAEIDRNLCIGCGLCCEVCPEVFELGDDTIARVIADPIPATAEESARDAAASCPVEAIQISD